MKRLLIILMAIAWPVFAWAGAGTLTVDGVASVATIDGSTFSALDGVTATVALSCPGDEALWIDKLATGSYTYVGYNEGTTFNGQYNFDPGANKYVCSVSSGIRATHGDLSGWTYQIEISPMSGNNLTTPDSSCISTPQTISSDGTLKFTGLNCALTNGTKYGIVLTRSDHGNDDTKYIDVYMIAIDNGVSGGQGSFHADRTGNSLTDTYDMSIRIYAHD